MNDLDGWKAFQLASTFVVGILAWLGKRAVDKIERLQDNSVTRSELKENMALMREERQSMHQENQNHLDRIEKIIGENEQRDSQTRHDIRETVHAMSLQLAVLTTERRRQRGDPPR